MPTHVLEILLYVCLIILSVTATAAIFLAIRYLPKIIKEWSYNLLRSGSVRESYLVPPRVNYHIEEMERDFNIRLTYEARQVLILAYVETLDPRISNEEFLTSEAYLGQWQNSVFELFQAMAESPTESEIDNRYRLMTTRSVFKAINAKWCRIPPFCAK
jgi:hypothetical protein